MLYHLKLFYTRVSLIIMASFKANIISSNSIPKKHAFNILPFTEISPISHTFMYFSKSLHVKHSESVNVLF